MERHLLTVLILIELILSMIFISIGYAKTNLYFRGVGVGLLIAWVTSAVAYFLKRINDKKM